MCKATVQSHKFYFFVGFFLFLFVFCCCFFSFFRFFFCLCFGFLFIYLFIYSVIFDLLIPWFANVPAMRLLVSLVVHLFLQMLLVGGRGVYLVPFVCVCFFCYSSFLGGKGKGYFILHVGGVMDSLSAGQSLTYVSILEVYISFEKRVQGSGCK